MQNGGLVPPFLIFCPHAFRLPRKKPKSGLRRLVTTLQKFFCRAILRVTHPRASKKNKIKQNLATQSAIGVRILPFSAPSCSAAQKNRRGAHFLCRLAAVP
jgi:hypothetical protein